MKVSLKVITEGPASFNFQAGDVKKIFLDAGLQPGAQEKLAQLVIGIDDPLNANGQAFPASYLQGLADEMQQEVYRPGPTLDANVIDKKRGFTIPNWDQKFSPEELDILRDPTQTLPDGTTSFGGTVLDGVVSGLFTFTDIKRK